MDTNLGINNSTSGATMVFQEALKYFGEILKIDPNAEFNSTQPGLNFKNFKPYDPDTSEEDDRRERALVGIGATLEFLGKHEKALKYLDYDINVTGEDNVSLLTITKKGAALVNLGQYEEAIKLYDHFNNGFLSPALLYNNKGVILANLGRYEEAIKAYDEGLQSESLYTSNVLHNKGLALANLGRYEEAIKNYDKVLDDKPFTTTTEMVTLNDKGAALSKLGKYEEAIKNYDTALSMNPNFKDALYNKAVTLGKMGETVKAIEYYNKVLDLDPSDTSALNNKFIELTKISPDLNPINEKTSGIWQGRYVYISTPVNASIYSDEMQKLKSEVEKNPKNYKLLVIYGKNLESGKHFQDAIRIYKKALVVNPSYIQALIQMGDLMIKMGDASGKNYIDRAKDIDPSIENYLTLDELSSPERFSVSETVWN